MTPDVCRPRAATHRTSARTTHLQDSPTPVRLVDAVKGLAGDAKQGGKNVASDLSEDIPNLFKDVGKNAEKVCIH